MAGSMAGAWQRAGLSFQRRPALNDSFVAAELAAGRLFRISPVELADHGYHLAYPRGALKDPGLLAFRDWILAEARTDRPG